MDKGRFLIETHLRTGRPIVELAAAHGVHRSWLYKLLSRYRRDGDAGLEPRSRRPRSSPTRIADRHEDAIVALRKELTDAGYDAGAATIHAHLTRRGGQVPSVSTIWRVLKARGFVTPQPHRVERFHQTLERYLAKQDPPATKKQLQTQLDRFVAYYNELRPHRAIGRRTPAEAFAARERAVPRGPMIEAPQVLCRSHTGCGSRLRVA